MKRIFTALLVISAGMLWGADIVWNADNDFQGWEQAVRMKAERKDGLLVLTIQDKDPILNNSTVNIDPKKYNAFEIVYRATGVPKVNWGGIYFAGDKNMKFAAQNYVPISQLNVDGEWHVKNIKIDEKSMKMPALWYDFGLVRCLRLDIIEQAEGSVEIKSISLFEAGK